MRIHRDGYIQTKKLEVWLPNEAVRSAWQVGETLMAGFKREVEAHIGICVEDAIRMRVTAVGERYSLVLLESDWARPTRS